MLCSEKELGFQIWRGNNRFESNLADKLGDPISEVLNKNDKIFNISQL